MPPEHRGKQPTLSAFRLYQAQSLHTKDSRATMVLNMMSCFSKDSSKLVAWCRVRRNMRLPLGAGLDLGRVLACILLLDGCSDLHHSRPQTSCDTLQQPYQDAELKTRFHSMLTYGSPVCGAMKHQCVPIRAQARRRRDLA